MLTALGLMRLGVIARRTSAPASLVVLVATATYALAGGAISLVGVAALACAVRIGTQLLSIALAGAGWPSA